MREIALAQTGRVGGVVSPRELRSIPGKTLAANRPELAARRPARRRSRRHRARERADGRPAEPARRRDEPLRGGVGRGLTSRRARERRGRPAGRPRSSRHAPHPVHASSAAATTSSIRRSRATGAVERGRRHGRQSRAGRERRHRADGRLDLRPRSRRPCCPPRPAARSAEAFSGVPIDVIEPHANRAIIFIFDSNNSVRVHDLMADCVRQPDDTLRVRQPEQRSRCRRSARCSSTTATAASTSRRGRSRASAAWRRSRR